MFKASLMVSSSENYKDNYNIEKLPDYIFNVWWERKSPYSKSWWIWRTFLPHDRLLRVWYTLKDVLHKLYCTAAKMSCFIIEYKCVCSNCNTKTTTHTCTHAYTHKHLILLAVGNQNCRADNLCVRNHKH